MAFALDLDDPAMVKQVIEHEGRGHEVVGAGPIPGPEVEVRGRNRGPLPIPCRHDREERMRLFTVEYAVFGAVDTPPVIP